MKTEKTHEKHSNILQKDKTQSIIFQLAMYLYPLALFAVFWFGTNINSIVMAFQNISMDGTRTWAGFANFGSFINKIVDASSDALLRTSFFNSLKMFFINLCVSMPLYLLFSFYLFKKMPGNRIIMIIIMVPSIISDFMVSMIFKRFINVLPSVIEGFPNLLKDPNYTFGTMLFYMIWVSFATSLIVYPNAMRNISSEILEAGEIDGTTWWTEFWKIIFPLIFPTISTFLITGVSAIFTNIGPAINFYQYGAEPEVYTVGYYYTALVMKATNETGYPELAAGGLILTAITCPLTFGVRWLCDKFTPEAE